MAEISVTLDRALLRDSEKLPLGASRSEAIALAPPRWLRGRQRQPLEEECVPRCEQVTTPPEHLLGTAPLRGGLPARVLEDVERGLLRAIGARLA